MIFARRDRRVIRALKTDQELRDEIVDTRISLMTPEQMRGELADRLYVELEGMDDRQLRDECDLWDVDLFNERED